MSSIDDHDIEEAIRRQAYLIWLEEGQPEGRSEEHWRLACELKPVAARENEPEHPDKTVAVASKTAS